MDKGGVALVGVTEAERVAGLVENCKPGIVAQHRIVVLSAGIVEPRVSAVRVAIGQIGIGCFRLVAHREAQGGVARLRTRDFDEGQPGEGGNLRQDRPHRGLLPGIERLEVVGDLASPAVVGVASQCRKRERERRPVPLGAFDDRIGFCPAAAARINHVHEETPLPAGERAQRGHPEPPSRPASCGVAAIGWQVKRIAAIRTRPPPRSVRSAAWAPRCASCAPATRRRGPNPRPGG